MRRSTEIRVEIPGPQKRGTGGTRRWKRDEEGMMRSIHIAMMLGAAMAASAAGFAQSPATAGSTETPAAVVPDDQKPTMAQLTKLFEVMRLKEQVQSMRQIVPSMVQEQIATAMKETEAELPPGTKLTAEQREGMEKVMSKYVDKSMELYPADEMLTDMGAIYQRHLSKDDVDGLIVFYSSPSGQHLLDAQPLIAKEYMPVVMGKVRERSQVMTKEMMKEMVVFLPSKQAASKPGTKPPAK
jgi:uncharacterized protein